MKSYDMIWIGTGQATNTILSHLIQAGKSIAVIEGGAFGGTCFNDGCTPTKMLVAAARAIHMAGRGADFGFTIDNMTVDFKAIMDRQKGSCQSASRSMMIGMQRSKAMDVYRGYAAFDGTHTVRINDDVIQGETILIHTGARPREIQILGLDSVEWLNNTRLLDLDELPKHLVILGGLYIGLEFAQIFRRFGSDVTIIEVGSQLVPREDPDIAEAIRGFLKAEGIQVLTDATVTHVSKTRFGKGINLTLQRDGKTERVNGSHLLVAVERVPNSDRLNLSAAGIEADERDYIKVNDVMQTNLPHVYAIGDVNGLGAFTHTSVNDSDIFWDHYSGTGDRTLATRSLTYAMYIDPPMARIGMNETQARASGRQVLMAQISRAIEKQETKGLVKLLVNADTEAILGATILGTGADEVIGMFATFMATGSSYRQFRKVVLPHPTVAELMPWMLDDLKHLEATS